MTVIFAHSSVPEERYILCQSDNLTIKYTNEDIQRLIDGPKIPPARLIRALPFELRDHLNRMREYQRALRRQGSTDHILPPGVHAPKIEA